MRKFKKSSEKHFRENGRQIQFKNTHKYGQENFYQEFVKQFVDDLLEDSVEGVLNKRVKKFLKKSFEMESLLWNNI